MLAGSYPSVPAIYPLDNTLQLLHSYTVANASSMYLEQSASTRRNLVVAIAGDCCTTGGAPSLLRVVDPGTGTLIWQSPPLLGPVSKNSLEFLDVNGDGQLEMSLGTAWGMYLTQ